MTVTLFFCYFVQISLAHTYKVNKSSTLPFRRAEDKRLKALHDARVDRTVGAGGAITVVPVPFHEPASVAPVAAAPVALPKPKQAALPYLPGGATQLRPQQPCRCGSTTHRRVTSKHCRLKKKRKRSQGPGAETATPPPCVGGSNAASFVLPQCRCGSTSHRRTSFKLCPLREKRTAGAKTPGVGEDCSTPASAAGTSNKRPRSGDDAAMRRRPAPKQRRRHAARAQVVAPLVRVWVPRHRLSHVDRALAIQRRIDEFSGTLTLCDDKGSSFSWTLMRNLLTPGKYVDSRTMDWFIRVLRLRQTSGTPVILDSGVFSAAMFGPYWDVVDTRRILYSVLKSDVVLWDCMPEQMRSLSSTGITLVPVNIYMSHWILLEIIDPGGASPKIAVYDSKTDYTDGILPECTATTIQTHRITYLDVTQITGPYAAAEYSRKASSRPQEAMTKFVTNAAKRWVKLWRTKQVPALGAAPARVRRAACPQQCTGSCACGPYVLKCISALFRSERPVQRNDSRDESCGARLDVFDVLAAP